MDPATGGTAEFVRCLSTVWHEQGNTVEVVCLDRPESPWLTDTAFRQTGLGGGHYPIGFAPRLKKWLLARAHGVDAMIVHGLWQYPGIAARAVAILTGIPYFVYPHGMLDPWFNQQFPLKRIKKQLFWWWRQYAVLRDARAVFFTCERERELAQNVFFPWSLSAVTTAFGTRQPPVVSSSENAFWDKYGAQLTRHFVLFLGRIAPKKGVDLLIDAWLKAPLTGRSLVIAGSAADMDWYASLQKKASASGGNILFTGPLYGDEKWGAFSAAEVFILPSHQENFGIAVAESLGCGCPVIVSDGVNIAADIVDAGAGIMISATIEGIHEGFARWEDLSNEARASMCTAAQRTFKERYAIEQVAYELMEKLELSKKTDGMP
jgi:glycosyltransferase involved in cell wall biosynthesis